MIRRWWNYALLSAGLRRFLRFTPRRYTSGQLLSSLIADPNRWMFAGATPTGLSVYVEVDLMDKAIDAFQLTVAASRVDGMRSAAAIPDRPFDECSFYWFLGEIYLGAQTPPRPGWRTLSVKPKLTNGVNRGSRIFGSWDSRIDLGRRDMACHEIRGHLLRWTLGMNPDPDHTDERWWRAAQGHPE